MRVGKKIKKSGTEGKTKPCFVRLEKVTSRSAIKKVICSKPENKMPKNFTGPIKKRPVSNSPTPINISKSSIIEKPSPTIAAGRSRRAIKPNPKYSNDDIVTPKLKLQSIDDEDGSDSMHRSNGKYFDDSSDTDNFYNKDDSSVAEDFSPDDEIFEVEDSGSDFEEPKSPPRRKPGRPRRIPTPVSRQSQLVKIAPRPLPPRQINPQLAAMRANSIITSTPSSSSSPNAVSRMRTVTEGTPISTSAELMGKKRKLNQTDFEKERENIIARNKRLNIALYDSNDHKGITIKSNRASIGPQSKLDSSNKSVNNSPNQSTKKLLPILPNDPSKHLQTVKKTNPLPLITSKMNTSKDTTPLKPITKLPKLPTTKEQPLKIYTPAALKVINKSSPTSSSSTNTSGWHKDKSNVKEKNSSKDDVEMMPTFTIVNINDIINKKGDVLIHKTQKYDESTTTYESSPTSMNAKSPTTTISPVPASMINNKLNRRKSGHTTLLSEKIDPAKLKNPMSRQQQQFPMPPSTLKKPIQKILNHTLLNKKANNINSMRSQTMGSDNQSKSIDHRPAPRILNSVVGKRTLPVQPMISKYNDPDDPDSPDDSFSLATAGDDNNEIQQQRTPKLPTLSPPSKITQRSSISSKKLTSNNNNNNSSTQISSKENINTSKKQSTAATTTTTTGGNKTVQQQRKLPPERVVVSRQGNKLIKKITCFETWYVINVPDEQPPQIIRNSFDLPLISLANTLDSIKLPSPSWSYKVNLYQITSQMLSKNTYSPYTGDLSEQGIKEEDRSKYQPQSVMFRRSAMDRPKVRLPYDRAVVFKNNTFFTNIDGKNVKLLGAPTNISSLEEIEILLDLIDEFTLQSRFVEQTPTV